MAQIVLAEAGAAIGARLLPQGVNVLGAQIAGRAIGRSVGSIAGASIDAALFTQDAEGPRLKALQVMESREGAPVANVYGRMRIGGQVIWAARFRESRTDRSTGGKGGPSITEYRYSVSFAVGICEGELTRIDQVWANGAPLALGSVAHRIYRGAQDQPPDALIEAIEGAAPAYRGLAYIVFEDLPLDAFGNRIPQLSFEVTRAPPGSVSAGGLRALTKGVNIIPASGEFVYATDVVRTRRFPAVETPINMNNSRGDADFQASLDQLQEDLPNLSSAALTVGWFGDDLRAGQCAIRPGVEQADKSTTPWGWSVGGVGRDDAYTVSQTQGTPNYGGTPADRAVVQGLKALKARGVAVTMSPFLFMDVAPGNGLPDPYGGVEQAAFPWRGRITASADGTSAVRDEINAFLGAASVGDFALQAESVTWTGASEEWGFRRFILHQAFLAAAAGGVEAFLIGSEMVALTRLRDDHGDFPFVDGLRALAADVRTILGAGVKISYAADWTEYGGYQSGADLLFPLDPLWADGAVDFVGVDWYPPMGDWRSGGDHLDAQAGYQGPDDPAYLFSQIEGGEAFDWYYANEADRAAQIRTPISDTAHGEDWVFRAKDLAGWWGATHHERIGGVRAVASTQWSPGMKPVRLCEIGFPAVDRGGNAPNLFFDPKSDESALPPYSTGERDDLLQRRALEAALTHFEGAAFVEQVHVWCWDGRPWPDFPVRDDVWSDGANWAFGHWLNGRVGFAPLGDIVEDICRRGGVVNVDAQALTGHVDGFALDGVHSIRSALEPLRMTYGFDVVERDGALVFRPRGQIVDMAIADGRAAGNGPVKSRTLLDKSPGRVRVSFADMENGYQAGVADARDEARDVRLNLDMSLPLAMTAAHAASVAERFLEDAGKPERVSIELDLSHAALEAGDVLEIEGWQGVWRIEDIADGRSRMLDLRRIAGVPGEVRQVDPPKGGETAMVYPEPELVLIDGPPLPGAERDDRPVAALSAQPWPGATAVYAGPTPETQSLRAIVRAQAVMARLAEPLKPGPVGRWDMGARLHLEPVSGVLSSQPGGGVLSGANAAFVQSDAGWELLAFRTAELLPDGGYMLTDLLRGLQGSDEAAAAGAAQGAMFVLIDEALTRADVPSLEHGLELLWRAGPTGDPLVTPVHGRAGAPWPVAHLRASAPDGGVRRVSWIPRGVNIPDNWDLPDPVDLGRFEVQSLGASGYDVGVVTKSFMADVPDTALGVRVASIGEDGRRGPWVSISW